MRLMIWEAITFSVKSRKAAVYVSWGLILEKMIYFLVAEGKERENGYTGGQVCQFGSGKLRAIFNWRCVFLMGNKKMLSRKCLRNTWAIAGGGNWEDVSVGWLQNWSGRSGAPHPHPLLGMYLLPTISTEGATFKDIALRKQCIVETIWAGYVTEPSSGLCITFKIWQVCVENYLPQDCSRQAL